MERVDVVVVGSGVMGSATARALARRRVDAVVLEQFRTGHARGSSHGPTRIFRLAYPMLDYVRLAQRALGPWHQLQDEAGEQLLRPTGGLDVGDVAELCATALGACGAPFEWLRPAEAMTRFPGFDFTGLDRVLFHPDAGVCLADRTVTAQVRLARAGGVDVREETEVLTVRPDAPGVVLETTAGDLRAGVVVVTAGPWASRVLADALGDAGAGARALLPSLQSVAYYSPVEAAMEAAMPTFVDWHGQGITGYAVPPGGVGQGVKVGDHSHGTPIDPTQGPFEVQPATLDTIAAFVARRLPGLAAEPVGVETCLYTFTPDEDFVLDRVGDVVVGAGFSGHGFKFGPLVGEVLADLATGREPDIPAERFAVRRSALRGA